MKRIFLILSIAVLFFFSTGAESFSPEIVIGFNLSMTGEFSFLGEEAKNAADMIRETINPPGGKRC
jgi:ABC-type branched-subunit amino acid transport system substrate-binding protein